MTSLAPTSPRPALHLSKSEEAEPNHVMQLHKEIQRFNVLQTNPRITIALWKVFATKAFFIKSGISKSSILLKSNTSLTSESL